MTVRLEELLAASTPGPWRRYFLRERVVIDHAKFRVAEINADPEGPRVQEDAALIALAPDAVRLLIDMGEELRAWESHNRHVLGGKFGGGQERDEVESLTTKALLARLDRLGNTA